MLDEHQRRQRRRFIGSSEAAAVVGKDPWSTPADVWLEKTGRRPDRARDPDAPALTVGTFMEEGILSWAERRLGTTFARDQQYFHPNGIMVASPDAVALAWNPPALIEAKTVGIIGPPRFIEDYGEDGSDAVPVHVRLQAAHQLAVFNAQPDVQEIEWVIVPALIIFRGFVMFKVRRSRPLEEALVEAEERFQRDYIDADVMPPDSLPSFDVLKTLRREPNKTVPVDPTLVRAWQVAGEAEKLVKDRRKEATRALLAALGDAEAGESEIGTVTYLETQRGGFEVAPSTFRSLRFKPLRGRKGRGRNGGREG